MWDILNSRNMFIFQDIKPSLFHICTKIIASFLEYCEDDKVKNPKVYVRSSLDEDKSICYFEGTEKDGCCWAGMIISIKIHHSIRLWIKVGMGTNSHVELLTLCGLLWFAKMKGTLEIQIVGDSNVVIVEDNGTYSLQNIWLEHWMNRVKLLIHNFANISVCHIYRGFSIEVDGLSEKAIGDMDGLIFYEFFDEVLLGYGIVCFEVPLS